VVSGPTRQGPLAWLRARGVVAAAEIAVNFVAPLAVYNLAAPHLGAPGALMAAAAPPILWSLGRFILTRRLDAISLLVLAGIGLSLLAFVGGGGVRLLQLRESMVTGLIGVAFLVSAALGRPLILVLAQAGARRRSKAGAEAVARVSADARFRRAMSLATLAWGFGLAGACAVNVALVFALPIRAFLIVGPLVSGAALGALTAWTFWFTPRVLRRAEADAAFSDPR
jgi:hypothetical protein